MMCARVRWKLSNAEGEAPSPSVILHLKRCETCATFRAQLAELEGSLKAGRLGAPLPTRTKRRVARWPVLVTGGLAVAVAIVLYVQGKVGSQTPHSAQSGDLARTAFAPSAPAKVSGVSELFEGAHAQLLSGVRKLGEAQDPLARELAAWRSDGLRGLESIRNLGRDDNGAL